ncbi:protein cytochrome c oxidase subunit IV [Nitrolancea hollandica]|uniref:Cytochrome c oxidase polypeptide IV n=1 Tax=Nitrolancea hollandica Lb TaxID=1129897 RepID=I4ENF3_9BACT|nr:protein cytochrome c oxidase subunit IV [Nitrolancea hollandica]CCF86216.1 hypothetical protein, putative Cytochrome c oxidase, subunit IV [Nitrolancea hollandica Lb]
MNPADSDRIERVEMRPAGHNPSGGERAGQVSLHLPSPSVWPVVVAAGLTLVMFGFITHPGFVAMGILLMILGLGRWVGELLRG